MRILEKGRKKLILAYLSSSINCWWMIFHQNTTKKIIKIVYLKLNIKCSRFRCAKLHDWVKYGAYHKNLVLKS